ncbi:uncharacterized protein LOC128756054 [Synchiropus splendidus]|uniref:uncharacterized protein LOC128756054 n=1 Tax=Synchiropus splendidus TaxID=270530 RepID=UPI00237E7E60|nr:uncharacterized protein LOC128756054 [Synchiropus splendidus]
MKRKGVFSNLVLEGLCVMLLAIAHTNSTTTSEPATSPIMVTETTMIPTETTIVTVATTADPTDPVVPNSTVTDLEITIDRSGCAAERICAAEPGDCDPSGGECFFVGAVQKGGQNFDFGLSGETEGYLACTLSNDNSLGGNDTTYVCAINNNKIEFFGALLNNGRLTRTEVLVNNVKGKVQGRKIQCTFTATIPDSNTRASQFSLAVSTGAYDNTTGTPGPPNARLQTPVVDISNPNSTVTNTLNTTTNATTATTSTTTSPSTTAGCEAMLQQPLSTALLLTLGVMSLLLS